jgi:membrane-bound lytic murein transglycosylase
MRSLPPISVALAVALLAACASGPPPQTTADLARANTLVAAAEQSGAQQYAAADLQAARDEAQQANQLASHDPERADEFANEAAADARLASARVQNAQAQHGLRQLHETLDTLRSEERRNMNEPSMTPPPSNDTPQAAPPPDPNAAPPQGGTAGPGNE